MAQQMNWKMNPSEPEVSRCVGLCTIDIHLSFSPNVAMTWVFECVNHFSRHSPSNNMIIYIFFFIHLLLLPPMPSQRRQGGTHHSTTIANVCFIQHTSLYGISTSITQYVHCSYPRINEQTQQIGNNIFIHCIAQYSPYKARFNQNLFVSNAHTHIPLIHSFVRWHFISYPWTMSVLMCIRFVRKILVSLTKLPSKVIITRGTPASLYTSFDSIIKSSSPFSERDHTTRQYYPTAI